MDSTTQPHPGVIIAHHLPQVPRDSQQSLILDWNLKHSTCCHIARSSYLLKGKCDWFTWRYVLEYITSDNGRLKSLIDRLASVEICQSPVFSNILHTCTLGTQFTTSTAQNIKQSNSLQGVSKKVDSCFWQLFPNPKVIHRLGCYGKWKRTSILI